MLVGYCSENVLLTRWLRARNRLGNDLGHGGSVKSVSSSEDHKGTSRSRQELTPPAPLTFHGLCRRSFVHGGRCENCWDVELPHASKLKRSVRAYRSTARLPLLLCAGSSAGSRANPGNGLLSTLSERSDHPVPTSTPHPAGKIVASIPPPVQFLVVCCRKKSSHRAE
jgi:hypothetical protein